MTQTPLPPVFLVLTQQGLCLKDKIDAYWQSISHDSLDTALPAHRLWPKPVWHISEKRFRDGRHPEQMQTFESFVTHCQTLYRQGYPIIGVCAAAILIRALGPILAEKKKGPPVLALSEDGQFCVSLLGGHHGGNVLADHISRACAGQSVITTAGDCRFKAMLDAPPAGWKCLSSGSMTQSLGDLLEKGVFQTVGADIPEWFTAVSPATNSLNADPDSARTQNQHNIPRIAFGLETDTARAEQGPILHYVPQTLVLGIGCARGISGAQLWADVQDLLRQYQLSPAAIAAIASVDVKKDEAALHFVAKKLGCEARFFPPAELEKQLEHIHHPSETVYREIGCHSVAEAAALSVAGPGAKLRVPKTKFNQAEQGYFATLALSEAPHVITAPFLGQAQGHLSLVSLGPGGAAWRTVEASQMLQEADIWVGYHLYLDLLSDISMGKTCLGYELGAEKARVREALCQAGEGKKVALLGSGDVGIYAMGALVFELLDIEGAAYPQWSKIKIDTAPGVSALQMAAARAGAPLGHDFCAISLSDLLTPRTVIQKRLKAAAEGDFVIAFYNPVSKTRRTLLAEARDILLTCRPATTPVWLARNLGRDGESHICLPLHELQVDMVDMLTTVIVGNSQSQSLQIAGAQTRIYTPRGYREKQED